LLLLNPWEHAAGEVGGFGVTSAPMGARALLLALLPVSVLVILFL
jgi:hypothetical protein